MYFVDRIAKRLAHLDERHVAIVLALAAFFSYTSMYSFRKSFTAGGFEEEQILGINYKVWLIIVQMLGYMISKFYGIRFIAESKNKNRERYLFVLIFISWLSLLAFALIPKPWNVICMFFNGFPLGMIWGLVFSYLEGRRFTEIMGAVMAVSLIFASGLIKSVGRWLMSTFSISEYWMPFYTGLLFFLPFMLCVWVLGLAPAPTALDKSLRTERVVMDKKMRRQFLKRFMPGIILTITVYMLLTVLRDVRDNFEIEIWNMLGVNDNAIYAKVDGAVALAILFLVALLILVKDNLKAFKLIHIQIICGFAVSGISTYLYSTQVLDGLTWMLFVGIGLYMSYIPYNAIFFERLIATFRIKSNVGFVMYLADSIGYLGSFIIMINKELMPNTLSWSDYFIQLVFFASCIGAILASLSLFYFIRKQKMSMKSIDVKNIDAEIGLT